MSECELLNGCLFFNNEISLSKRLDGIYKAHYCMGNKASCARYMVAMKLGRGLIPNDLFPNLHEKAQEIIEKG